MAMISSKKFLSTKSAGKLPSSLKDHPYFRDNKYLEKIFPKIGLKNDRVRNAYKDPQFGMLDLVFSAAGTQCFYDLATMSMRGALSCMHWANSHSTHVIGSVVDPFCAIIYLTDRKHTKYGRSIIKRSLVRLLAKSNDHTPHLFIERPYTKSDNTDPFRYANKCNNPNEISTVFANYLSSKTGLEVRHTGSVYIPAYIPHHKSLAKLTYRENSISDFGLGYYEFWDWIL